MRAGCYTTPVFLDIFFDCSERYFPAVFGGDIRWHLSSVNR